jgi:hypothetical protein
MRIQALITSHAGLGGISRSGFLNAPDADRVQAAEIARALVGDVVHVTPLVSSGRNSRIWHVRGGCQVFALKQYPSREDDPRDRLATEVGALRLMERHRIQTVPRVIGFDRPRGYALLSWIDGAAVVSVDDGDIDAATDFLAAIHRLRAAPEAAEQPFASEACLSGREIERQILVRLEQLRSVAAQERELIDFLDDFFTPAFAMAVHSAYQQIQDFDAQLTRERCTLVPSDFGFHNCLRRSDGSLAFVDFEYFGWDDPVKLTADILLHPARPLDRAQRVRFRQAAGRLYSDDPQFSRRLSAYLPLFGLRWVLIMLNEFIPERWRRRVLAGDVDGWSAAKARQLSRAREFLSSLPEKQKD